MTTRFYFTHLLLLVSFYCFAQPIQDNFDGNSNIDSWVGDDCIIEAGAANPLISQLNTSAQVLSYRDVGGTFANVRFDIPTSFDLATDPSFEFKIYVPSSGLSGNQPNQVSLKLQDGNLAEPWSTQTEIIKPLVLDQWQVVTFNFATDPYINLNAGSPSPIQRSDFNRVLIQVNGENNNDPVTAFIDDFFRSGEAPDLPVYDQLVWSDEFETNGPIDPSKWFAQTQIPVGDSWFNGEIQHYTNRIENASVEDGILRINARRETFTDQGVTKQFTSARLNSKFAFTYGRVEIRAKLPFGVGTWPAIWMLGTNISENGAYWETQGFGTTPWPACGEIDIMEHWGDNQNFVQSAMHTPSSFGNTINKGGQIIPTASTEFHNYELIWSPDRMIFSVDGVVHYIYQPDVRNSDTWPFDADQYLILNVAILPIIQASFTESAMEIDYVRVYGAKSPSSVANNELSDESFLVYPNPFQDWLAIELPEPNGRKIIIQLFRADGRLVQTLERDHTSERIIIDGLGDLAAGPYLIRYASGEQSGSRWLVR